MFVAARSQENRPMFSATSVLDLLLTLSYHLHHGFTKLCGRVSFIQLVIILLKWTIFCCFETVHLMIVLLFLPTFFAVQKC